MQIGLVYLSTREIDPFAMFFILVYLQIVFRFVILIASCFLSSVYLKTSALVSLLANA